ncbi:MAG TPA: ABC transporter ATP-binding protein [Sediminibacterium sp.]|nr:ABC transporter ATP-binding protein [Sediminibacterium sp.]
MSTLVQVSHLSKQFQHLTAVDDLSFNVEEGDVYGFLGQNGAGKSTTLRMLLTLIAPSSGRIEMFGKSLSSARKEILSRVGAMIEKPDLYKYLSAYDNLELFVRLSGIRPQRAKLMAELERVGLAGRAKDAVRTYSQGMKQRLGIAIALAHDPDLVILDEPTNGLDPQGIADIRNLILHLHKDLKKTLIISSHLLSEMEQVATRILIIDQGKKMMEGYTASLLDPSRTIVSLQTTDNKAAGDFLAGSAWSSALQETKESEILLQMRKDRIPELVRDLIAQAVAVLSVQARHSLEDYFLQVTTGKQHVDTHAH